MGGVVLVLRSECISLKFDTDCNFYFSFSYPWGEFAVLTTKSQKVTLVLD